MLMLGSIMLAQYYDVFLETLDRRESAIESMTTGDLEGTGRFSTDVFWALEIYKESDLTTQIFGLPWSTDVFPHRYRLVHVDYTRILFQKGFIGFIFFITILSVILYKSTKITHDDKNYRYLLKTTYIAIFLFSLFVSISGSFADPLYRGLMFLFFGAVIGTYVNRQVDA